jgi:hypothetical protein
VSLMFSPTAGGIRETVLHSATAVQVASRNVNSPTGERMMSFPEASEKNNYNAGLRLLDPSTMLFVGICLVGFAIRIKGRAKRS